MNYSKAIFLISDDVSAIMATYENNEGAMHYTFKTTEKGLKVGDYVVVETDTRHGMTVNKVTEVDIAVDIESDEKLKWVISKVDKEAFNKLKSQENQAIGRIKHAETNKRRDELRESLIKDTNGELKSLPIYNLGDKEGVATPHADDHKAT